MNYLAPGVYVEEVPSSSAPIAGVGTSTAAFIGVFERSPVTDEAIGLGDGSTKAFPLRTPIPADALVSATIAGGKPLPLTAGAPPSGATGATGATAAGATGAAATAAATGATEPAAAATTGATGAAATGPTGATGPAATGPTGATGAAATGPTGATGSASDARRDDAAGKVTTLTLASAPPAGAQVRVAYRSPTAAAAGEVKLCTNFTEFVRSFGGFTDAGGQRTLAHAVYGFFNNGGTRCFVAWQNKDDDIDDVLSKFDAIDEIAIVAAPGLADARGPLVKHCSTATGDRFAILDAALADVQEKPTVGNTTYAALYYPNIMVVDPVAKALDPAGDGLLSVPPSGHLAGIYARVDTTRGVHKAPANEVVYGAVGLAAAVSRADQDGLNPKGINCIRSLNNNVTVWGARTVGGDANGEFKYVNVRRLFLYLRKSIDQGTQWAVFEPNSPALWEKIKRNVSAFLTNVWRDGALFGATPQEAFYVKCDAETNPPDLRDLGQLVTEIGVAVVKPAEFVVFRISQWAGPGK